MAINNWTGDRLVNQETTSAQTSPETTTLANGNYVVLWTDNSGGTTDSTAKFRIYDPTGVALTDEILFDHSNGKKDTLYPTITAMSDGGFVIAADGDDPTTGTYSGLIIRYDANGTETFEGTFNPNITQDVNEPEVITVGSGYWVFYTDSNNDVQMIRFDGSNVASAPVQVNQSIGNAQNLSAAYLSDTGRVVVTWEAGSTQTAYQLLNGFDGSIHNNETSDFWVNGSPYGVPKVVEGPQGGFVIAYNASAAGFPGDSTDPLAFVFNATGVQFGDQIWLPANTNGYQHGVELVSLADGSGFMAIYMDENIDGFVARTFDWFGQSTSQALMFSSSEDAFSTGSLTDTISATVLADGRVAVAMAASDSEMDNSAEGIINVILDPRNGNVVGTTGNETMWGGSGNDVFHTKTGDDIIYGGGGNDTIIDDGDSTTSNLEAYGEAGEDMIFGYAGDDYLDGGRGDDVLEGGGGTDEMYGGNDDDILRGGDGDDTIMRGNNGQDIMIGGMGRDMMGGGPAADTFVWLDVAESTTDGFRDRVLDFRQALDLLDVSAIDANTATTEDDAFFLIGSLEFTGNAGQLRFFNATASKTVVEIDNDGDAIADMSFDLLGQYVLVDEDFIL